MKAPSRPFPSPDSAITFLTKEGINLHPSTILAVKGAYSIELYLSNQEVHLY